MEPRFRLQARVLYLTYPQISFQLASTTKEDILERIKEKYNNDLNWCVIGEEVHEDGNPHIHVCISLHKKINYVSCHCLDWVVNKHGNYQAAKNILSVIKYCVKDNNYCEYNINSKEYIKKRLPTNQKAYSIIHEGGSLEEIDKQIPGYLIIHLRQVEHYMKWVERCKIRISLTGWKECYTVSNNEKTIAIVEWLNLNICKPREYKQRQLYIQSDHNKGKSTLINMLDTVIRVFIIPNDELYYDLWEENTYDLIVFDEFRGQKKISFMNEFMQGSKINMPFKGGQRYKKINLPILICSNEIPKDCYPKVPDNVFDAFCSRLYIIENIEEFINIQFN